MEKQLKILVVDDDKSICRWLNAVLTEEGYVCCSARSVEEAEPLLRENPIDLALLDIYIGQANGLEFLEKLKTLQPECKCVVMTAHASVETVARSVAGGALEYLSKPLLIDELLAVVHRAEARPQAVPLPPQEAFSPESAIVGRSPKMLEVYRAVARVAPSTASVLITGASGTGKELVARAIHEHSPRRPKPFVAINCAAIPETLIESEIFGHEKGAFTGALERRTGCFELAEGGTLLLDEIGEMPVATQAKLLRVLEDSKLRRLGSKVETTVDVRVLAATNKVPEEAVARGELRNDLYYRLNVFNIHMPPVREHKEDLPEIVEALLNDLNEKHGTEAVAVDDTVMKVFQNYGWPGNVRELRNTLERAVILAGSKVLGTKHLPPGFGTAQVKTVDVDPNAIHLGVGTTVEEAEKQLILRTLASTSNNKTRAAEILGISLKTLHNKLKEYGSNGGNLAEAVSH